VHFERNLEVKGICRIQIMHEKVPNRNVTRILLLAHPHNLTTAPILWESLCHRLLQLI
jgi:hypothetical protein